MFDVFYIGTKPNLFAHEQQVETIGQAQQLTRTRFFWMVSYLVDYSGFDFLYEPVPWQAHQRHAWPSQWQQDSGTYLVPAAGYTDTNYHAAPTLPRILATAIYEIDHMDGAAGQIPGVSRRVRYFDNYRDTLIRLANSIDTEHEFVWVCSSICDYTGFDFSWHPSHWQYDLLHVFASNDQKFGDTFFMHVPSFAAQAETVELLDWYGCNFVDKIVPRRPIPVIEHDRDSQVDAVKTTEWAGPLALFTTNGMPITVLAVNLWRSETKTITPLSLGASAVVVPRVAVPYIKTQLYDYPYIDKKQQTRHGDDKLDIVFISNGEPNAKQNFKRLNLHAGAKGNRLVAVNNINGRAAAYHAAAQASTTPWFFAVFAKLEVDIDFDFTWQPDRMQQAKHYIFHAKNPVNGLVYGHQAMIAYNRQLVLANPGVGLDFTLDSPHEVVPILSGVAHYDTSPWSSWRTAFRECIKLKASLPDVENEYRLNRWLDVNSDEADPQWSRLGAEDAVEYYDQVNGDLDQLKKSYEWEWLASYVFFKRNLTPNQ